MSGDNPTVRDQAGTAILILGAPRSGTTWLAKIFDSHPEVLYRHEPDETHPAPSAVTNEGLRALLRAWIGDRCPRTAAKRPFFPKSWQPTPARLVRTALAYGLNVAGRLPGAGAGLGRLSVPDLGSVGQARVVIKSVRWSHGVGAFARTLPDSRTVVILRHPGGQIASVMRGAAQRRFELRVAGTDMPFDEVKAIACAASRGVDSATFQALPDAAKYAWGWVAFNETMVDSIAGQDNARTVLYEDLCARPEEMTRALFGFAGLAWNQQTETFLSRSTSYAGKAGYYAVLRNSIAAANQWRSAVAPQDQSAMRTVVRRSSLACLWPDLATDDE